jgi:hypothetical protein
MTYEERKLRMEREWLWSKYDSGAVSSAVFAVIKKLVGAGQCRKSSSYSRKHHR